MNILKEIPHKLTFIYYFMTQNFEKINQITENIISFNKDCLEEMTFQLQHLHSRWGKENSNNLYKQKKSVLKFFLASFKNRLNHNQVESIEKFWEFYSMYFRTNIGFFNTSELKGEIISSISYIIEFFNFKNLSASNKIYIHLFISLKMFLEGTIIATDEFLEQLEKNSLIEELEGNKKLLCDFIRVFPLYQISAGKYYLQETKLFNYLLSKEMLNWFFYESPFFFSNSINVKIFEKKHNEAFDLIIYHTKYLSINKLANGKQFKILENFIKSNSEIKFEMLLFFLQPNKFPTFHQNNFLSSFILMVYVSFESEMLNQLKFLEIKRVYVLSAISIDKFPEGNRINLRKMLHFKFRDMFKNLKTRKKRILHRQEDYSRDRVFLIKRECQKIIQKKQRFYGKFKMHFQNHLKKLKNILKIQTLKGQKKLKGFDYLFE